ncbi:MAG TPA: RICIN domain-containing protein [Niastella sp.]
MEWHNSLTKQYIFKRIDGWLNEHFGANHGITCGVSEWGTMASSNPTLESVIYASHLGTFANNGVEFFSPWNWSIGMWETLHLFSRNAKKYSVSSASSNENTVSAYSSVNENADSLTVMLVSRDMSASRTVTINLSNFSVANGNYKTLRLSSLPATETFVSHTQNALTENTVAVNSNSLTITVPALSTTAILLVKATAPAVTYVTLANRATGLLIDGMYRSTNGDNVGQWSNSSSTAQQWSIENVGNYVMLKNRASGLYVDGMYRSANGDIAGQWSNSGSDAQQWTRETAGNYVKFKNKATGLYLDGMGRTVNGDNLGQWSQSNSNNQQWTLATVGNGRIATVADTDGVLLLPNPFKSSFNLKVSKPEEIISITIFDMLGRQVETIGRSAISNSVTMGASLKSGMYMVQVYGINGVTSYKVVKK